MGKHYNPLEKEFLIHQYKSNMNIKMKDFCEVHGVSTGAFKHCPSMREVVLRDWPELMLAVLRSFRKALSVLKRATRGRSSSCVSKMNG